MKYHKQEFIYIPDGYPDGSCYPTVYACILDLPLNHVPYFNLFYFTTSAQKANIAKYIEKKYKESEYSEETKQENINNFQHDVDTIWNQARRLWLISMGYTEEYIADHDKWLKENPNRPYIASGGSPRSSLITHVVIYQNGKMIHDPHPDGTGLTNIDSYTYLRNIEGDWEYDRYYLKIKENGHSN